MLARCHKGLFLVEVFDGLLQLLFLLLTLSRFELLFLKILIQLLHCALLLTQLLLSEVQSLRLVLQLFLKGVYVVLVLRI